MRLERALHSQKRPARRRRGLGWLGLCFLTLGLIGVVQFPAGQARAQIGTNRLQNDFGDLLRLLTEFTTQVGTKTRGEMLSFLTRIEVLNVESEIDRLVGNPWELSDSTSYKLSLAPLHVAFPVYDQLVQQMTRLDDLRSRRIQNLTVDSVGLIAVNLDILNGEQSGAQLANSLIHYFDGREVIDLGVFLMAQQPYFPQTQDEWDARKHQIAAHQGMLALTAVGLGTLFEAGALNNSGTIRRCQDDFCRLGWYGGFTHFGYHLQPNLRAGLTLGLPFMELSAGLMEQIRPSSGNVQRVFEVAMRESWLNRYTGPSGWNSFVEAALRKVLAAQGDYQGESFTGRGGAFVKREEPFRWHNVTLRASAEVESNLNDSLRFAFGLGLDYAKSGLSTVLQSSRTLVQHHTGLGPELRTGLFLAGTVEPPAQYYVEAMAVRARLLREEWELLVEAEAELARAEAKMRVLSAAPVPAYRMGPVFGEIRRASAASEAHLARVATMLGDYLESRRIAYSLEQWHLDAEQLNGSLDGAILLDSCTAVGTRLAELATFLQGSLVPLRALREKDVRIHQDFDEASPDDPGRLDRMEAALANLDEAWHRESEAVGEALRLYSHYLASSKRIAGLAGRLIPVRQIEPIHPRVVRNLVTLIAQPMQ